ncbi:MAG: hypothetical protein ABL974_21920 [Prosthecobacter sp.]
MKHLSSFSLRMLPCIYLATATSLICRADEQQSVKNSLIEYVSRAQTIKVLIMDSETGARVGYSGELAKCPALKSNLCSFFKACKYESVPVPVAELSSYFATNSFFVMQCVFPDRKKANFSYVGGYIHLSKSDSWSVITNEKLSDLSQHFKSLLDACSANALTKVHFDQDEKSQQEAFFK